jgi:hypothetical protein
MSSEVLNLILGAVIAFLSSLLTVIVSHGLQLGRERQKRTWDLEDQSRGQRIEILKERIAQAEAWVEGYVRYIDRVQRRLLFGAALTQGSDPQESREWLNETLKVPQEYSHRKSSVYRLNDPELIEIGKKIDRYWLSVAEVLRPLREGQDVNKVTIDIQLAGIWDTILKIQGEFLARLDQLRLEAE